MRHPDFPVSAHVAAIDGRHAIPPVRSSRPPRGWEISEKDGSTSHRPDLRAGGLRSVSKRPIFSPSSSSSISVHLSFCPTAHTYTFFSSFLDFPSEIAVSLSVGSYGLYKVDRMELEQVWEAAVPPGRKQKPSTHTGTWERKNEQSRRKIKHSQWKGVCKGRESFMPRPLKRGTSHCSLIQRGETGKVSVCVWEREKVKALLNPQNIMMIQEALREVNGGECVSEKVK